MMAITPAKHRHNKQEHFMSLLPQLRKISDTVWELPVGYKEGMLVPARIIASESLLGGMEAGVFDSGKRLSCWTCNRADPDVVLQGSMPFSGIINLSEKHEFLPMELMLFK
jgi:hypothetical protein